MFLLFEDHNIPCKQKKIIIKTAIAMHAMLSYRSIHSFLLTEIFPVFFLFSVNKNNNYIYIDYKQKDRTSEAVQYVQNRETILFNPDM